MRASVTLVLAALVLVLGLVVSVSGCGKDKAKAKTEDRLRVDSAERDRGLRACAAYVERACRCAKTNPGFTKICDVAQSHKTSLQMMIDTIVSDQVDNRERVNLLKAARRTIETCFSAPANMDPGLCPVR